MKSEVSNRFKGSSLNLSKTVPKSLNILPKAFYRPIYQHPLPFLSTFVFELISMDLFNIAGFNLAFVCR